MNLSCTPIRWTCKSLHSSFVVCIFYPLWAAIMFLSKSLFLLVAIPATLAAFPDCKNGPAILTTSAVCNVSLTTIQRASAIVSAMTLEEKINNTGNGSPGIPRLGLPAYQWWQEGKSTEHILIVAIDCGYSTPRSCVVSGSYLCCEWKLFLRN